MICLVKTKEDPWAKAPARDAVSGDATTTQIRMTRMWPTSRILPGTSVRGRVAAWAVDLDVAPDAVLAEGSVVGRDRDQDRDPAGGLAVAEAADLAGATAEISLVCL